MCEWEGAREILAAVGEEVEMECRVRASPPQVTYEWESITVAEGREMVSPEGVLDQVRDKGDRVKG